jgi:hypothetical protein
MDSISLGHRISALPRDMQREIIHYIGKLSMVVVRHTIFKTSIQWDLFSYSHSPDIYSNGINFFIWVYYHISDHILSSYYVAKFGDPDIVKFLIQQNKTNDIITGLAAGGHLELLKFAKSKHCPWSTLACAYAAENGYLNVLQWLRSPDASGNPDESGKVCPWNASTIASAAKGGHLNIVQWARSQNCPWDRWTCAYAAEAGHLDILIWARENGCQWDASTCSAAARGGHLDILIWARANGCPWNSSTCSAAAKGGHLNVLKWARFPDASGKHGCDWDADTFYFAVQHGNITLLEWLRFGTDAACPWNSMTCTSAAMHGRLDILKWLISKGCPCDYKICLQYAAQHCHSDVLEWLRANGCPQ